MKIAILLGSPSYTGTPEYKKMMDRLASASAEPFELEFIHAEENFRGPFPDLLMSVGGDGTFLAAVALAAPYGIPLVGVNMGRMGFLSENEPEDLVDALCAGDWRTVEAPLLRISSDSGEMLAFNEISVTRAGGAMLGIDVKIDSRSLPTYWADGLLVSTQAGSTAYSLSLGGPIVLPGSKVLIICPMAPHNLNIRPMVVPLESVLTMTFKSRDPKVTLTADNCSCQCAASGKVEVSLAPFTVKMIKLKKSNYLKALSDKLYWGEDIRNEHKH